MSREKIDDEKEKLIKGLYAIRKELAGFRAQLGANFTSREQHAFQRNDFQHALADHLEILEKTSDAIAQNEQFQETLDSNGIALLNDFRRTIMELDNYDELLAQSERRINEFDDAAKALRREIEHYDADIRQFCCPVRGSSSAGLSSDAVTALQELHRRVMRNPPERHSAQAILAQYQSWLQHRQGFEEQAEATIEMTDQIAWYYEAQRRAFEILLAGEPSPRGRFFAGVTQLVWTEVISCRDELSPDKLGFMAESACRQYKAMTAILKQEEEKAVQLLESLPQ